MVAKWVIAVFFSVSALLARDVRAVEKAELKAAAKLASRALKLAVEYDPTSYYVRKDPEAMLRIYRQLSLTGVAAALKDFSQKCRVGKVEKIIVSGHISHSSNELWLDHEITDVAEFLSASIKRCDATYALLDSVNTRIAPKKLEVSASLLISDRIKHDDIAKWSAEITGGKFMSLIDDFEVDCRHKINKIDFQSFSSYESKTVYAGTKHKHIGVFNLAAGEKAVTVNDAIADAAESCRQVFGSLIDFNRCRALSHGLFFKFDVNDFLRKRITAGQVLAWIKHLSKDSKRLGVYRDEILTQSTNKLFDTARECSGAKKNSRNKYCQYLIQVEFAIFSEVMKPGMFSAILTTFLVVKDLMFSPAYVFAALDGSADLLNVSAKQYRELLESRVYFDVTKAPPPDHALM